jgi:hypothetical protein
MMSGPGTLKGDVLDAEQDILVPFFHKERGWHLATAGLQESPRLSGT